MKADRLEIVHEWSLYLVVLLPVLPLIGTTVLPYAAAALFFAALMASWFTHRAGLGRKIPERLWNVAVLSFVGLGVLRVVFTDTDLLDTVVQLLLILTIVKLFGRWSVRDELQVFVLSLITLAAATTLTDQLVFGAAFSAYVLAGTFALAVFHLRNEVQQRPKISFRGIPTLNRSYALVLAGMSAVVLAASLLVFFAFPRIGLGFFAPKTRDALQMTGFSESVELGNHGVIRDNPAVVIRVEFDERPKDTTNMHWRMMSFDNYDGHSWSRTLNSKQNSLPRVEGDDSRRVSGLSTRQSQQSLAQVFDGSGKISHLQVYLEPLGTTLLPTLWTSESIRLGSESISVPVGPRSGRVERDKYGDIHHTVADQVGLIYQLWAWETPGTMPVDTAPDAFLQLPPLSERFQPFADSIAPGAQEPALIAEGIKSYLQQNYTYTTDLPQVGVSPIESFLFETRRGHCEYFATSATILLRARGVPARIVNGFLGGSWNSVGSFLAVRQGDAHTWVEYFDANRGWVMIDPTPASLLEPPNAAVDAARQYYDAMKLFWTKWIIEYDLNSQLDVFRRLATSFKTPGTSQDTKSEDDPDGQPVPWGPWVLALASLALAWLFASSMLKNRRDVRWLALGVVLIAIAAAATGWAIFEVTTATAAAASALVGAGLAWIRRPRVSSIDQAWFIVERAAKAAGIQRQSDEGPEHFLDRLALAVPTQSAAIGTFQSRYLAARFGANSTQSDIIEAAERLAKSISAHAKTGRQ